MRPESCRCRAHSQHRIFKFFFRFPSARQEDAAKELHTTGNNVKVALHRLRKRIDISRRCPECFAPSLLDGACNSCGFEPASGPFLAEVDFESQSQTNALHSGGLLGSDVDYSELRIRGRYQNDGILLRQKMERALEDTLSRDVKSLVMQELKRRYQEGAITDFAGRLCAKEVDEFRCRYPRLATSKNVKRQLAANVLNRLKLLYPSLTRPQAQEVTRLQ